ncbi:MAG: metallophosphoesterase [Hymenobacteraceae bacterium]|nr:metallophosphoesterase [Hymenobacteraceae bacterium]MDX5395146.1 metallophosphoesterase [Hymenobacteraceae bacterium]MDX5442308.1 metallophosphoesterase [Hymenobacteraceae bacterium]MDX5511187.1 metallophosphoesterase [Hymenobacteraceae bacterium]
MKRILLSFTVLTFAFLTGCDKFEYSPYVTELDEDEKNLNAKNVARIQSMGISGEDTLRFVLTADTQGFYEETDDMVKEINKIEGISFVLHGGDITDFGLLKEYKWIHQIMKKLKVPYVTVVGNHDCLANGKIIYQNMYGPFNHSFVLNRIKFIFFNTNTLEFREPVPDMDYLRNELAKTETYDKVFVITHVPPHSPDFDQNKKQEYFDLMRQYNVVYSLHGHNHNFEVQDLNKDGIDYLTIGSSGKRSFVLVKIFGDYKEYKHIEY